MYFISYMYILEGKRVFNYKSNLTAICCLYKALCNACLYKALLLKSNISFITMF